MSGLFDEIKAYLNSGPTPNQPEESRQPEEPRRPDTCPIHGKVVPWIAFTLPNLPPHYICWLCLVATLDRVGVTRLTVGEEENK